MGKLLTIRGVKHGINEIWVKSQIYYVYGISDIKDGTIGYYLLERNDLCWSLIKFVPLAKS